MPVRNKISFKTWMLVYAVFAVALAAATLDGEPAPAVVSPGNIPSAVGADEVFFMPTIKRPRRNDI